MLLGIIEALWLRRGPHFWDARWLLLGRVPAANRHVEILEALRSKDGARASAELKTEIESTTAYLLERMSFVDDPGTDGGLEGLQPLERVTLKRAPMPDRPSGKRPAGRAAS
jgi:hypothetical protein